MPTTKTKKKVTAKPKTRTLKDKSKVVKKVVKKVEPTKVAKIVVEMKDLQKNVVPKKIDLSVIIVSLNTKDLTKQTIDSALIAMENIGGEIIVVDNNSNDGSIEMIQKYGSKVKLVENRRNLGFGSANDRGAKHAKGKYLMFLNSDTIVPKNTFSEIIKFLDQNEEVGLLSPKLVNNDKDHSLQLGSFGKFSTPWRILFRSSRKQPPLNSKGSFTKVDWVSGAAMVIRHNLFTELKGFDENIFLYFEDEDLCRRANSYDFDTVVLNNSEIVHLNGQSTNSKKRTNYYDQSQDYFIDKYFGVIWASLIHVLRIPYRLLR